jgi:hypothetical protein
MFYPYQPLDRLPQWKYVSHIVLKEGISFSVSRDSPKRRIDVWSDISVVHLKEVAAVPSLAPLSAGAENRGGMLVESRVYLWGVEETYE